MFRRAAFITAILAIVVCVSGFQANDWIKFVSPDGTLSVLMPATPKPETQSTDNPQGKIITNIWIARTSQGVYLAGATDYPVDLDVHQELALDRDNFLKAVNAKLVSESDITLRGYPGKEFTGVSDDTTYKSRIVVVGRRHAYQVVIGESTASFSIDRAGKFLLSFDIPQKAK
jgi:hypothetical protein